PSPRAPAVLAMAASTGGPAALYRILSDLGGQATPPPPILLVQHIALGFGNGLATWLGTATKLRVKVAEDGEPLTPGTVYLAPDDKHLGVTMDHRAQVSGAAPIQGFRPSANWLFRAVARAYGQTALAVVLTGMGQDGLDGIRDLHQAGGRVIAQDEATSVVYGMPAVVVGANLAHEVLPLGQIARRLLALFQPGLRLP
ncbi:chemotaxis protein CheB, partial [Corallococcus exercitus]|uniref:CheB methylesterase domain-containing protein n=1 Tax=Corallococcus exercitus TaxID=2316736 RepID=UPI000EDE3E9B